MIRNRLILNGIEVDILTDKVKINKQVNGLDQFDNRQVDVTDSFFLANTDKNNRFFNFLNIPSSQSNKQTDKIESKLYLGTTLVFSGFCRVIKVVLSGKVGYKVRLVSAVQTIKQLLSDTKLADLDYSSINHYKTRDIILDRLRNRVNTGFTYALFDPFLYEISDGTVSIQPSLANSDDYRTLRINIHRDYLNVDTVEFPEFQPVLYTSWIISQISDLIGKNFTGGVFVSDKYIHEVRNTNKAIIEHPKFDYNNFTGIPIDKSHPEIIFENIVHDVDLWTIFSDFLISFGQVFIEKENTIEFVGINSIDSTIEDWNKHYVDLLEGSFEVPKFGQNNEFTYKLNRVTESILQESGAIDFNFFYSNGYHVQPYEFEVSISNENLDLNKNIYESKFFNQFDRVFTASSEGVSYTNQTNNPYGVVPYAIRVCNHIKVGESGGLELFNLYFNELYSTLINDLQVPISSVNQLISYEELFDVVESDNANNAVVESRLKELYDDLQGDAPMCKYYLNYLNVDLFTTNNLNRTAGSFPNTPYSTFGEGIDDYNFLQPVELSDIKVNNQSWFDILNNYKEYTFELDFSLLDFYNIDLTTAKNINGSIYYVSKIEKFILGQTTKVKMVKIK